MVSNAVMVLRSGVVSNARSDHGDLPKRVSETARMIWDRCFLVKRFQRAARPSFWIWRHCRLVTEFIV